MTTDVEKETNPPEIAEMAQLVERSFFQGLLALHESPLKYHGHLTSRNVLVDSRWNCKISDYGLHKFRQVPVKQPSNDPFIEGKIYEGERIESYFL